MQILNPKICTSTATDIRTKFSWTPDNANYPYSNYIHLEENINGAWTVADIFLSDPSGPYRIFNRRGPSFRVKTANYGWGGGASVAQQIESPYINLSLEIDPNCFASTPITTQPTLVMDNTIQVPISFDVNTKIVNPKAYRTPNGPFISMFCDESNIIAWQFSVKILNPSLYSNVYNLLYMFVEAYNPDTYELVEKRVDNPASMYWYRERGSGAVVRQYAGSFETKPEYNGITATYLMFDNTQGSNNGCNTLAILPFSLLRDSDPGSGFREGEFLVRGGAQFANSLGGEGTRKYSDFIKVRYRYAPAPFSGSALYNSNSTLVSATRISSIPSPTPSITATSSPTPTRTRNITPTPTATITPSATTVGDPTKIYWRFSTQKLHKVAYHKGATIIGIYDGKIYKSTDGANTWNEILIDPSILSFTSIEVTDICCTEDLSKILITVSGPKIVGISDSGAENGRPIIKAYSHVLSSIDGGISWTKSFLGSTNSPYLWESPTGFNGVESVRSLEFTRCSCSFNGQTIAIAAISNKFNDISNQEVYHFLLVSVDGGNTFTIKEKIPLLVGGTYGIKEYGEIIVSEFGNRVIVQKVFPKTLSSNDLNGLHAISFDIYDLVTNTKRIAPHKITVRETTGVTLPFMGNERYYERYAKIACNSDATTIVYLINYKSNIRGNNPQYISSTVATTDFNKIAITYNGGQSWTLKDGPNGIIPFKPNGIACNSFGDTITYYEMTETIGLGSDGINYGMFGYQSNSSLNSWKKLDVSYLAITNDGLSVDVYNNNSRTFLKQLSFNTNDARLIAIDGADTYYISSQQYIANPTNTPTKTPTTTPTVTRTPTRPIASRTPTLTPTRTVTKTVTPTPTKIPGDTGRTNLNKANYGGYAKWFNGTYINLTTVGTNGGPSYYGTYDQTGLLDELISDEIEKEYPSIFYNIGGNSSYLFSPENTSNKIMAYDRYDRNGTGRTGFRICSIDNPLNLSNFVKVSDVNNLPCTDLPWLNYLSSLTRNLVGSVGYEYFIGKFLVTNCEYADFLNSVAQKDYYGLYGPQSWPISGQGFDLKASVDVGIERIKQGDIWVYKVKPNMANKPVNYVNIFNAARYCNWLYNGKPVNTSPYLPSSSITEDGVYIIDTSSYNSAGTLYAFHQYITKRPEVNSYYIPSLNEWFKAAYYNPLESAGRNYWYYATQSRLFPEPATADQIGDGPNTISLPFDEDRSCFIDPTLLETPTPTPTVSPTKTITPTPTQTRSRTGNYGVGANSANWNYCSLDITDAAAFNAGDSPYFGITTVGTNGGPSYYGTYDQGGNIWEWTNDNGIRSNSKMILGGSAFSRNISDLSLSFLNNIWLGKITTESSLDIGFRVAASFNNEDNSYPECVYVGDLRNNGISTLTQRVGSVTYDYFISKYPITNCQYIEFLNSVASISDPNNLYSDFMNTQGGINKTTTESGIVYLLKNDMGNKPVNHITWLSAVRYCNWLHNGKPIGLQNNTTTENGAYTITATSIVKNDNATYYLPTINEWVKAAYYKGGSTNAGYWEYPTQSSSHPSCVNAIPVGNGPYNGQFICNSNYQTPTPTPTITPTITLTQGTPTPTPTISITPSITKTKTATPTRTPTKSRTPTPTKTVLITPTPTKSITPTPTKTRSVTNTGTQSITPFVWYDLDPYNTIGNIYHISEDANYIMGTKLGDTSRLYTFTRGIDSSGKNRWTAEILHKDYISYTAEILVSRNKNILVISDNTTTPTFVGEKNRIQIFQISNTGALTLINTLSYALDPSRYTKIVLACNTISNDGKVIIISESALDTTYGTNVYSYRISTDYGSTFSTMFENYAPFTAKVSEDNKTIILDLWMTPLYVPGILYDVSRYNSTVIYDILTKQSKIIPGTLLSTSDNLQTIFTSNIINPYIIDVSNNGGVTSNQFFVGGSAYGGGWTKYYDTSLCTPDGNKSIITYAKYMVYNNNYNIACTFQYINSLTTINNNNIMAVPGTPIYSSYLRRSSYNKTVIVPNINTQWISNNIFFLKTQQNDNTIKYYIMYNEKRYPWE